MKKIISILLLLCLLAGILPVTVLADNTAKVLLLGSVELTVTEGGKAVYTRNKEFDASNAPDGSSTFSAWTQEICDGTGTWNVKFEWPTGGIPTITLKDAKFDYYDNDCEEYAYIDQGGDYISTANRTTQDLEGSTAEGTDYNLLVAAIMPVSGYSTDLQIVLKGDNLIETGSGFVLANPAVKENGDEAEAGTFANAYFKELYFVGEGENNTVSNCDGIGIFNRSGYDVSFRDVNLTISTTAKGTNAIPIHVTNGNLTIDGGSINVTKSDRFGIWTTEGGDITINSGTVKATGSQGAGATNGVIRSAGKLIINGGTVKANPQKAVGLYGGTGIEINGGTVEVTSPYYAINAGGDIVFNGGTTTLMAQYAFYNGNNIQIGPDVMAYAGVSKKNAEIYDGTNTKLSKKPWMLFTNDPDNFLDLDEDEDSSVATVPTVTPTLPAVTTAPSSPTTPAVTYTQATAATQATRPSSTKVTRPVTTPTYSVGDKPIDTKPVTDETLATEETTVSETTASKATEAATVPSATKAPETSAATEATQAPTQATEEGDATKASVTKDKNKGSKKDKDSNEDDDKKSPNAVLIIVLVVVVLAGAGAAAWFALKPKSAPAEAPQTPKEKTEE